MVQGRWMIDLPSKGFTDVSYYAHFITFLEPDRPICKKIIPGKQWMMADREPRCEYCEAAIK